MTDNRKTICIAIVTDNEDIPETLSLSREHLYADYDIVVVGRFADISTATSFVVGSVDVLVVANDDMEIGTAIGTLRQVDSAIGIVAISTTAAGLQPALAAGAQVVMTRECCCETLAADVLSAYHMAQTQQVMCERLAKAEEQVRHDRLIGQAVSILARQGGIPEIEARHHLRQSSRNKRQPMHELALHVVESADLLKAELCGSDQKPEIGGNGNVVRGMVK